MLPLSARVALPRNGTANAAPLAVTTRQQVKLLLETVIVPPDFCLCSDLP